MAKHLDLEEQEQLDQLKHFWKIYGSAITGFLFAGLLILASWNGFQYWERTQASQAATLFDEVDRIVRSGDITKSERAFGDMKERFGSTAYSHQAGLMVAKLASESSKNDVAKSALTWVYESSKDQGYASIARLRLSALLIEEKSFDNAMQVLNGEMPPEFAPLVSDRRGDITALQGKPTDARAHYQKAFEGMDERTDYRRLVEIKLNALGGSVGSTEGSK